MRNALQNHLQNASDAEAFPIIDHIEQNAAVNSEILSGIEERLNRKLQEEAKTGERFASGKKLSSRSVFRVILIAAALSTMAFLMMGMFVPGVSKVLYGLAHPDHSTESYLLTTPEERDTIPEIEEAIEKSNVKELSYSVEMRGEYSLLLKYDEDYNKTANEREKEGFPPYRAEDYAFLKTLVPEKKEVYYDGTRLTVSTYFPCDFAGDFLTGWGINIDHSHNLDMTTFEINLDVNGQDLSDRIGSWASGTMMSVWGKTKEDDFSDVKGFWCSTDIDELNAPLPDGTCTITLLYYIYDGDVDDMGSIGNVARVIHRLSFDTTPGNHHQVENVQTDLHGDAVITMIDLGSNTIESRTVSLEGLKLETEIRYLPSGLHVTVSPGKVPNEWNDQMLNALFGGSSFEFDLLVDGEKTGITVEKILGDGTSLFFDLPVLPSDYPEINEITLVPRIKALTSVTPESYDEQTKTVSYGDRLEWTPDGEAVSLPSGGYTRETYLETVLNDCEIHIPVPRTDS